MLKIDEIVKATKGRLVSGFVDTPIKGISIDSRVIKRGEIFLALKGNSLDGHNFIKQAVNKGAAGIIASLSPKPFDLRPKMPFILVEDTTRALGDIARATRKKYAVPVIAITGSNGKTTIKEMLAWVLSAKFKVLSTEGTKNNHIGLPLALTRLDSGHGLAVLELGTNHFGEINYLADICQPNVGIIGNIGPSHLEHFKDLTGVFKEKYALIKSLKSPAVAIFNADDPFLEKKIALRSNLPLIFSFGIKQKSDFFASQLKSFPGGVEFLVNNRYKFSIKTLGKHNIYNALAAIAIARLFGMEYKDISRRLRSFVFPKGRFKLVELSNVRFIDDTYNSNPLSLGQALGALENLKVKGRKIFIMGDMLELGRQKELFHSQAGKDAARICHILLTVGKLARISARAARSDGLAGENIFTCQNSAQARDILFNRISPNNNDIVLIKGSRGMNLEEIFKT